MLDVVDDRRGDVVAIDHEHTVADSLGSHAAPRGVSQPSPRPADGHQLDRQPAVPSQAQGNADRTIAAGLDVGGDQHRVEHNVVLSD